MDWWELFGSCYYQVGILVLQRFHTTFIDIGVHTTDMLGFTRVSSKKRVANIFSNNQCPRTGSSLFDRLLTPSLTPIFIRFLLFLKIPPLRRHLPTV
jgi:hypothetical protein